MEKPKNRIVIYRMNSYDKSIRDYITRKDALSAFYEICDDKGYHYGRPVFDMIDGKTEQVGMESGGVGHDYRIVLYI